MARFVARRSQRGCKQKVGCAVDVTRAHFRRIQMLFIYDTSSFQFRVLSSFTIDVPGAPPAARATARARWPSHMAADLKLGPLNLPLYDYLKGCFHRPERFLSLCDTMFRAVRPMVGGGTRCGCWPAAQQNARKNLAGRMPGSRQEGTPQRRPAAQAPPTLDPHGAQRDHRPRPRAAAERRDEAENVAQAPRE